MNNTHEPNIPKPRQVRIPFKEKIQRFWYEGLIFPSIILNGFTIYVPIIERFMLRQVRPLIQDIQNPLLKERVDAFVLQEVVHAREHEKSLEYLHDTKFKTQWIYAFLEFVIDVLIENLTKFGKLIFGKYFGLAAVAGAEHWTTVTAEINLNNKWIQKIEGNPMLWLFAWHGAEEIEHKSVVFDMLKERNDSYFLRIFAYISVSILFLLINIFTAIGMIIQLKPKEIINPSFWAGSVYYLLIQPAVIQNSFLAFFDYLRPNFHPDDRDNMHLMEIGLSIARKGEKSGLVMDPLKRAEQ